MSLPGVCFWNGGLDGSGMPHGEGCMTIFHPVTEAVLAVERRKMDHGHVISATVAPAHYTHVEPVDVTATVAHIVDDDWLFDNDEEGDKGRVAEKVRRVVFRRRAVAPPARLRLSCVCVCADLTAPVRVNLGRETTYSDQPQGEEATGGQASAQCASSLSGTRRADHCRRADCCV